MVQLMTLLARHVTVHPVKRAITSFVDYCILRSCIPSTTDVSEDGWPSLALRDRLYIVSELSSVKLAPN